jgi:hypothetical protein
MFEALLAAEHITRPACHRLDGGQILLHGLLDGSKQAQILGTEFDQYLLNIG